jgi:hypothetical protein
MVAEVRLALQVEMVAMVEMLESSRFLVRAVTQEMAAKVEKVEKEVLVVRVGHQVGLVVKVEKVEVVVRMVEPQGRKVKVGGLPQKAVLG